ncbi:MAG: TDP-N-acetylfucosamine:lipid II N-acetylfucosaminyltransferase [Candidatus Peribacteraceae bacterium]|nr:TDP-N-acetylfucosamine:lipid II N-acetylfucosaminyltransferase [Candidatus Peribacteraceae bacterium]
MKDAQKKIIVHIVYDWQLTDRASGQFEAVAPGMNKFVILGKDRPLRSIKKTSVEFYSIRRIVRLLKSRECAAIIFHSLPPTLWHLLWWIPKEKKVIWIGLGHDYYEMFLSSLCPNGLLMEKTKKMLQTMRRDARSSAPISKSRIFGSLRNIARKCHGQHTLTRVDIFSPVLDIEYELIRQHNPWLKAKYIPWNYGKIEEVISSHVQKEPISESGHDILVGNSASPFNNHLEIFDLLNEHVDLSGRRIFTPLGYGGNERYVQQVVAEGQRLFGEKFHPLMSLMDIDEYRKLLLHQCGYAFMNHLRQQAADNVNIMLYKGASVYLNTQSPLYTWLTNRGFSIRSMEEISKHRKNGKYSLQPLRHDQQSLNIEMMKKHWNADANRLRTKHLVDAALASR